MTVTISELCEKDISILLSDNLDDEESIGLDDLYTFDDEPFFYKNSEACVLRFMALEDVDNIRISENSNFKDDDWDLGTGFESKDMQTVFYFSNFASKYLKRFVKCWAYYILPEFSDLKLSSFKAFFNHISAVGNHLYDLGFFKDIPVDISCKGLDRFTLSDRESLFERIRCDAISSQSQRAQAIQYYYRELVVEEFLPREYCFPFDIFDGKSSYFVFPLHECNTWMPLAPEVLYPVAQTALSVINDLSDDIIFCFNSLEKSALIRDVTDKSRHFHVERMTNILNGHKYACWPDGTPWHVNVLKAKYEHISIEFIRSKGARLLRSACEILISLCLGLRISELAALKSGCCKKVTNPSESNENFEISVTIFKTVKDIKGKEVELPCPPLVFRCVKILESLFEYSRKNTEGVDYLIRPLWDRDGRGENESYRAVSVGTITNGLCFFAEWCGVSVFHHHQFRKTVAQFIVHRDPRNLDLVKLLFSHASLSMSLIYIVHIPTISRDIRNQIIHENIEVFSKLLFSASQGTVGGYKREHIIASSHEDNTLFKGETQYELGRNIFSYIDILMRNGSTVLRRTPMNICISEESPLQPLPCRVEPSDLKITNKPNISNCKGYECANAVFTEDDEPEIRNDIKWYEEKILNNEHAHENLRKDAQQQLSKLYKILNEITLPVTQEMTA